MDLDYYLLNNQSLVFLEMVFVQSNVFLLMLVYLLLTILTKSMFVTKFLTFLSHRHYFAGSYYAGGYANSRHTAYFDSQFHPNALSTATASATYPASSVNYPSHLGGIGKTYPMGAAVQSGFSYSYPRGMHQVIFFLKFFQNQSKISCMYAELIVSCFS